MLGLCRQFHCLPSAVLAEDAYLLRLLAVEQAGSRREREPAYEDGGEPGWPTT